MPQARAPIPFRRCVRALADLGTGVVVEIDPRKVLGKKITPAWPRSADGGEATGAQVGLPVVLSSQQRPSGKARGLDADGGFVAAVADAYGAGLAVSFAGLFAGESRRRISLPSYPFQRQRHWIDPPRYQAATVPPI